MKIKNKTYEAHCVTCGHKANNDEITCSECGSKVLVLGKEAVDYIRGEISIECICGESEFNLIAHGNQGKVHKQFFECDRCKKLITINVAVK